MMTCACWQVSLAEIEALVTDMTKAGLWPDWLNNKDSIRSCRRVKTRAKPCEICRIGPNFGRSKRDSCGFRAKFSRFSRCVDFRRAFEKSAVVESGGADDAVEKEEFHALLLSLGNAGWSNS